MNEELISIVIPTYKRPKELDRAIKSVINQTYKNLEIIVIDDNCKFPDVRQETENVISKYSNVIYIKNSENLGGSGARNVGINIAKGDYIAFLDDDDEFLPDKIEKQKKLYDQLDKEGKNVGIIYCYANMIRNGKIVKISKKDLQGIPLAEHMIECIAATSWWLCKKKVLKKIGCFDSMSSHQDAGLILKLLANGYEVYRVPEVLLNYYIHDSEDRITKINQEYINTEMNYREVCRREYSKIEDKKKEKEVEYSFKRKLCLLYIKTKEYEKAKEELKEMHKLFPFRLENIKSFIRFLIKK